VRRLVVVCTASVLCVGSSLLPAFADPVDVPSPPSSLSTVDRTASGSTLSWGPSPSSDVTGYQVQRSDDGTQTWADLAGAVTTETTYPIPAPAAGRDVAYRVVAESAAGKSAPTEVVDLVTPGTATQTFVVRTAEGQPVINGNISWSDGEGTWHSGYELNAHGAVTLSSVPAGQWMEFRVNDAYMASDLTVDKTWLVDFGTQPQTIVVPDPPAMETHRVTVLMPGGVPAVGVEVNAYYYHALDDVVQTDGYTYASMHALCDGMTGADGTTSVTGWSPQGVQYIPAPQYPYPQRAVLLLYSDSVLRSESVGFLTGDDSVLPIAPMPYTTTADPTTVPIGDTASVRFQVHAAPKAAAGTAGTRSPATAHPVSGVRVTLAPPGGWSASACSKKSVLTGVTNSSGYVTLPVCASRLTRFKVHTKGALPTAPVTINARHAAPGAPSSVSAHSPARTKLQVSWAKASYTGGASVAKYRIVATSAGHRTATWTSLATTRSHTFTGLARSAVWTVTVSAVNAYGTSHGRSARVRVH
jgi:hypothetical protein